MKKLATTSIMALALAISANIATAADFEAPVNDLILSGELSVFGGYASVDDPDDELDNHEYGVFGGFAAASVPFSENFAVQLDLLGDSNSGTIDDEGHVAVFGVGGHVSWRDSSAGLFGVFGGYGQAHSDTDDNAEVFWVGAEGQMYFDMLTLYGQVGYVESDSNHNPLDYGDIFARGVVRYFVNENFRLQGDFAFARGRIHSADLDTFGWGLQGKLAIMDDMPVYGTLEYRGTHYDGNSENEATEHAGLVGVSIAFGAPTLYEQDRRGVTLDTSSLILRNAGWTSPLD